MQIASEFAAELSARGAPQGLTAHDRALAAAMLEGDEEAVTRETVMFMSDVGRALLVRAVNKARGGTTASTTQPHGFSCEPAQGFSR